MYNAGSFAYKSYIEDQSEDPFAESKLYSNQASMKKPKLKNKLKSITKNYNQNQNPKIVTG